jgi:hypothetical protein
MVRPLTAKNNLTLEDRSRCKSGVGGFTVLSEGESAVWVRQREEKAPRDRDRLHRACTCEPCTEEHECTDVLCRSLLPPTLGRSESVRHAYRNVCGYFCKARVTNVVTELAYNF